MLFDSNTLNRVSTTQGSAPSIDERWCVVNQAGGGSRHTHYSNGVWCQKINSTYGHLRQCTCGDNHHVPHLDSDTFVHVWCRAYSTNECIVVYMGKLDDGLQKTWDTK